MNESKDYQRGYLQGCEDSWGQANKEMAQYRKEIRLELDRLEASQAELETALEKAKAEPYKSIRRWEGYSC